MEPCARGFRRTAGGVSAEEWLVAFRPNAGGPHIQSIAEPGERRTRKVTDEPGVEPVLWPRAKSPCDFLPACTIGRAPTCCASTRTPRRPRSPRAPSASVRLYSPGGRQARAARRDAGGKRRLVLSACAQRTAPAPGIARPSGRRSAPNTVGSGCAAASSASAWAATPVPNARRKMPCPKCCCARCAGRMLEESHDEETAPRFCSPGLACVRGPARPLTIRFEDATAASGIQFTHSFGARKLGSLLESTGAGCVWFDYNNDGLPDLYVASGKPLGEDMHPYPLRQPPADAAPQSSLPQRRQRQIHRCHRRGLRGRGPVQHGRHRRRFR